MSPTASPLGAGGIIAECLFPDCFFQGSRDPIPRSSGPCSDTANVSAASNNCPTPEATPSGGALTVWGPRTAWTLSGHARGGSQSGPRRS
eukprot:515604-Pyramimonas_sp.AAC.1